MIRAWVVFILLMGLIVWAAMTFLKTRKTAAHKPLLLSRFAAKTSPGEIWSQLYETDSLEDLNALRMRLGEENVNFIAFEQGKRDSQGNIPRAFGVVVAKAHLSRAQTILARILS